MSTPRRTLLAVALVIAVGGCASVTGTGDPSTAATVNGEPIEIDQVEAQYDLLGGDQVPEGDSEQVAEMRANALQYLVRLSLLEQGAADLGVEVSEEDIDQAREALVAQFGGEEALEEQLEIEGLELSDLDMQFRSQALETEVAQALQEDFEVTDEHIQDAYDEVYADRPIARHILVDTEEEAEDVISLLDRGMDFGELAVERSTDPTAPENEGDLGTVEPGQTVPEFEEAVFEADVGEILGPVESQFGFHVIEVTDVEEVEGAPDFEEVEEEIRAGLEQEGAGQEAFLEWIRGVASEADVEINPRFGEWDAEGISVLPTSALDQESPVGE